MSRYTLHAENLHLFPLDLFWKQFETYLPARRQIIYSQSRWVGGFREVRNHRRDPLSPPHLRNAELMGISQREATFQSTRPRHTCRAPGVSCLHHASLDTGTGIHTSTTSKSSSPTDPRVYQSHNSSVKTSQTEFGTSWCLDSIYNQSIISSTYWMSFMF